MILIMTSPRLLPLAASAFLLIGCGGSPTQSARQEEVPAPAPAAAPAGEGVITGRVIFAGAKPVMKPLTSMDANPQCLNQHGGKPPLSEEVVVNADGTLKNVFLYVKSGLPEQSWPVPPARAHLDQVKCIYTPHVLGLMVGQELEITNSDPVNHNIHPIPMENREWNESQPPQGDAKIKTFAKPELKIPFKCNVHPWMRAYVHVVPHPFFAVTGDDGKFEIKGLPPGEYVIEAVHEKYPPQEIKVKVEGATPAVADFTFKG
jgi:plastocyanin